MNLREFAPDVSRIDAQLAGEINDDAAEYVVSSAGSLVLRSIDMFAYEMVADALNTSGVGGAAIAGYNERDVRDLVRESGDLDAIKQEFLESLKIVVGDYVRSLSQSAVGGLYKR